MINSYLINNIFNIIKFNIYSVKLKSIKKKYNFNNF